MKDLSATIERRIEIHIFKAFGWGNVKKKKQKKRGANCLFVINERKILIRFLLGKLGCEI